MTDANLMDAKCIHDNYWDECELCAENVWLYGQEQEVDHRQPNFD